MQNHIHYTELEGLLLFSKLNIFQSGLYPVGLRLIFSLSYQYVQRLSESVHCSGTHGWEGTAWVNVRKEEAHIGERSQRMNWNGNTERKKLDCVFPSNLSTWRATGKVSGLQGFLLSESFQHLTVLGYIGNVFASFSCNFHERSRQLNNNTYHVMKFFKVLHKY